MSSISFLPADLSILDVEAVLDAAEAVAEKVAAWPPGSAGVLSRDDWRALATGEVLDLGRLVVDLMRRGAAEERWAPGPRDRTIALVERSRTALPEAAAFFASAENSAGLRKLKARQLAQRRNDRLREERASKSLQAIEISVHPDDAAELRAIAAEMLRTRGIKPIELRKPGRPRKSPPVTDPPSSTPVSVSAVPPPPTVPAAEPFPQLTLDESMKLFFKDTPSKQT
jgi:hypothetical protein